MEIIFSKKTKILSIILIMIMLISIISPVFAAYTDSLKVGDKLKFTGISWCTYSTEANAKKLRNSNGTIRKGAEFTILAKNGNVLKIGNNKYIYYGSTAKLWFTKVSSTPQIKYTIQFNANGGSGSSMQNQTIQYGVASNLRRNTFTRNGYVFAGWTSYRKSDNKWLAVCNGTQVWATKDYIKNNNGKYVVYADQATTARGSAVNNDTITMYAQWNKYYKVTGITINTTTMTLEAGKTQTRTATISPSNATNKGITYTSSNTNVATVDSSGKVTAKSAGTATITATSKDQTSLKTSYKVTVTAPKSITIPSDSIFRNQSNKNKMWGYRSAVTNTRSIQYKLLNGKDSYAGRVSTDSATNIVKVDGYYCSALGTYFGKVGDKFTVTLDNGKTIKVIMCDAKGNDAPYKKDGKTLAHDYEGTRSFLEFYCNGAAKREGNSFAYQNLFAGKVAIIYNETTGKTFK